MWVDDADRRHAIRIATLTRIDEHIVAFPNVANLPEERVAMSGDGHVARLTGQGSVLNVARTTTQRACVGAMQDDGVKVHPWNRQRANCRPSGQIDRPRRGGLDSYGRCGKGESLARPLLRNPRVGDRKANVAEERHSCRDECALQGELPARDVSASDRGCVLHSSPRASAP